MVRFSSLCLLSVILRLFSREYIWNYLGFSLLNGQCYCDNFPGNCQHGKESKHGHKSGKALKHAINGHTYRISSLFFFKWFDSCRDINFVLNLLHLQTHFDASEADSL